MSNTIDTSTNIRFLLANKFIPIAKPQILPPVIVYGVVILMIFYVQSNIDKPTKIANMYIPIDQTPVITPSDSIRGCKPIDSPTNIL